MFEFHLKQTFTGSYLAHGDLQIGTPASRSQSVWFGYECYRCAPLRFLCSFEEALMSCCGSAEVNPVTPTLKAMYYVTSVNTFISVK